MSIPITFNEAKENIEQIKNHLILTKRTDNINGMISAFVTDKDNDRVFIPFKYCLKFFEQLICLDKVTNVSPLELKEEFKLRKKQEPVVEQALNMLHESNTLTLNLHTGFGKTIVSLFLCTFLGGVSFFILKSKILIDQWIFSSEYVANGVKIYVVGEKNNKGPPFVQSIYDANIVICMNLRIEKVPIDFLVNHVTTLVIDEVDDLCTPTGINAILRVCPKYIINCTATLRRRDGMIDFLYLTSGKKNLIRRKYEGPLKIYKVLTGVKVKIKKQINGKVNWTELNKSLFDHEERNKLICALTKMNQQHKILILTWYKYHVKCIYNLLKKKNDSCTFFYDTQKTYNDSDILISTISKVSRGFDEKTFCKDFNGKNINVLILVGSTKSLVLMEQMIGRILRSNNPIMYYLIDDNPISKSHYNEGLPLFKELNGSFETINMKKQKNFKEPDVIQKQLEFDSKVKITKINAFLNMKK